MCGSTGAQDQIQQEQIQAYQQAQQLTAEQYANQQAIFAPMAAQFQSILQRGPNAQGFSGDEMNELNAESTEGVAENYQQAARALNENIAAEGGGNNPLPSGGQIALKERLAASAAQTRSGEENQIESASYNQGHQEWMEDGQGLEAIAAGENPLGYEGAETSAGSAAGTTADQIAEENNSWINAAIGAAGSVAGGWATGGFKH